MLPYFDEYCDRCEKSTSLKVYALRLRKLNVIEENVFDMSAEEIADVINAKNAKPATLYAFYSSFGDYLMWAYRTYDLSITDIYYQLGRLRELATEMCNNNLNEALFSDFAELKKVLLQTEEEFILIKESNSSERELNAVYLNQKKFNASVVFIWNGFSDEEMMSLTLNDILSIIMSGRAVVNGKAYDLSDDETELLSEAYQSVMNIKEMEKHRPFKKTGYKRKHKVWTYDNLFNTMSKRTLNNLKYLSLGKVSDPRLDKPSIVKSGIFHRMYQYEKENDYVFSGTESYDVCCKLLKTSIFKAQRLVSEYNKFRKSTEKTEDI